MSKGLGASDAPNIAKLSLDDTDEDLFASPGSGPTTQKQNPIATNNVSSTGQQHTRPQSKQDIEEARNAQLRAELEKVREVNKVIEGVTASLSKAKENMETVHKTVNNASTLLATWTRILSQTEHNQRVILNPNFQGASQDLEDIENEEIRRQHEADRRIVEEQRRREEAQRKAEEEERRKAAAVATGTRGVSRTRSVPAAGLVRPEAEDEVSAEIEGITISTLSDHTLCRRSCHQTTKHSTAACYQDAVLLSAGAGRRSQDPVRGAPCLQGLRCIPTPTCHDTTVLTSRSTK